MTKLALDGGKPAVEGPLQPFNEIGVDEMTFAADSIGLCPLSGFLGGQDDGGLHIQKLEYEWCEIFGVKHAVSCNSATSGLLMACMAAGVCSDDLVTTTPFTMSATAAAPLFLEASLYFGDIEPNYFCLNGHPWNVREGAKATIVTNLFGHPALLKNMRGLCDQKKIVMIEDNAQAPFAMEDGRYAGTVGHMGVFSLNVHKHLHAGEGGVVVTNDDDLALRLRAARNHGEMAGHPTVGLNFRMTEVTAAIALAQLNKRERIMRERIEIAEALTDAVKGLPGIAAPQVRDGCKHVYYCWAARVPYSRDFFVRAMNAEGVPIRSGYVEPLYRLPAFSAFARECPVAERMHDEELVLYENCAWTPNALQLKQFKEALEKVTEAMVEKAA